MLANFAMHRRPGQSTVVMKVLGLLRDEQQALHDIGEGFDEHLSAHAYDKCEGDVRARRCRVYRFHAFVDWNLWQIPRLKLAVRLKLDKAGLQATHISDQARPF